MPIERPFRFVYISLAYSILASIALTGSASAVTTAGADQDWQTLSASASVNYTDQNTAPSDATALGKARAQRYLDVAKQAQDFYTKNPKHANARKARKLEALNVLYAARSGAVAEEPRAIRLAMALRNDNANEESDRFELASAMADYQLRKKAPASLDEALALEEKKADDLIAEFPTYGEVYRTYVGLMKVSAEPKARQLAQRVLLAPAPQDVKDEAQFVLDRLDLVGSTIPLEFTSTGGSTFNLAEQKGKIVVVYAWTTQSPATADLFSTLTKYSANAVLVGINIDQDPVAAAAMAKTLNAPGLQYTDSRGLKNPIVARLKIVDVPSCYVFSRNGSLVRFGSVDNLAGFLALAGK